MSCFDKTKRYLIFGTGITGKGMAYFCQKNGLRFYITDDNNEKLKNLKNVLGDKKENDIKQYDILEEQKIYDYTLEKIAEKKIDFLLLSPAVHAQNQPHKIVIMAQKLGIKIVPDIDLLYAYLQEYNKQNHCDKKIVAITGTNGKSTTTAIVEHILKTLGKRAIMCGNNQTNCLVPDVEKYDFFIVEMSSYNLFLSQTARFDCGVLLNITEDHLEYHGTMENYADAKMKVISKSNDAVFCVDSEWCKKIAYDIKYSQIIKNCRIVSVENVLKKGFSWKNDILYLNAKSIFEGEFPNLKGRHNVENILCAVACVYNFEKDFSKIFEAIKSFQGLKHRMQFVRAIDDIEFINDSKGTNADSTQKALQAYVSDDVYLIAGGQRKSAGFLFLKDDLASVKCVFLIGDATESFAEELDNLGVKYKKCGTMDVAVKMAFKQAKEARTTNKKKVVLLSPLCASWDQYKSFEARGEDFIKIVNGL